jgi:anthranilate synthase/aminodeoxychorismate synthase-like glutamine amidotransferase
MILLIDNYDSFTYNLVQALGTLGVEIRVARNDALEVDQIRTVGPDGIIISPGPGRPRNAGISRDVIGAFAGEVPILGVCLGHQCIAERYGSRIVEARRIVHGKASTIHHDGRGVFRGIPTPLVAARYHSLAVDPSSVPDSLEVCAWAEDGEIMGIRHRTLPVEGVQFHPESFLTRQGSRVLANFIGRGT